MSKSIIASFESRASVEAAITNLIEKGYSESDLSILVTDDTKGRHFEIESTDKTSEGIGKGAVLGGGLGALAAGLTAVGTVATGGSLLIAGPIVTAFAGAGAGSLTGGLIGGLIGLGIPEHEAKLSSEDVEKGSILVGVNASEDRVSSTKDLLKESGAANVTVQA